MVEKEMYNFKDVATILGVSVRVLYKWQKDGQLKAVMIGREYKVTREEIDRIKKEGIC